MISCKNKNDLIIDLYKRHGDPSSTILTPVSFLNSIPEKLKDVYTSDSLSRVGYFEITPNEKIKKLFKEKKISEEEYQDFKSRIYLISGLSEDKQFFIVDENMNFSFKDDEVVFFDKQITNLTANNNKLIDSLFRNYLIPVSKVTKDFIYKDTVSLRFYPDANYFDYPESNKNVELKNRLQLITEESSYFYGEFSASPKEQFKVRVNKDGFFGDEFKFSNQNQKFSNAFYDSYLLKDDVKIGKEFYVIDTLILDPKFQLKLKKNNKIKQFGFRPGFKMKDYGIENLEGDKNKVSSLFIGNQKLLLLDFWGTWCEPCKELTPRLIQLNKSLNDNLGLVSVAYQEDIEPVKKYNLDNDIKWFNGIVKEKPKTNNISKSPLIRELRIIGYPTFILVDKELNILYKSYGNDESFDSLVQFVNNYLEK
ncbi:TlpA family protein disulfide reductase [Tenacibaculum sp. ZS6-P6]